MKLDFYKENLDKEGITFEMLQPYLKQLTTKCLLVIILRWQFNYTHKQIADYLNSTREKIGQVERRVWKRLDTVVEVLQTWVRLKYTRDLYEDRKWLNSDLTARLEEEIDKLKIKLEEKINENNRKQHRNRIRILRYE